MVCVDVCSRMSVSGMRLYGLYAGIFSFPPITAYRAVEKHIYRPVKKLSAGIRKGGCLNRKTNQLSTYKKKMGKKRQDCIGL